MISSLCLKEEKSGSAQFCVDTNIGVAWSTDIYTNEMIVFM
jgi:hypothetical protein